MLPIYVRAIMSPCSAANDQNFRVVWVLFRHKQASSGEAENQTQNKLGIIRKARQRRSTTNPSVSHHQAFLLRLIFPRLQAAKRDEWFDRSRFKWRWKRKFQIAEKGMFNALVLGCYVNHKTQKVGKTKNCTDKDLGTSKAISSFQHRLPTCTR